MKKFLFVIFVFAAAFSCKKNNSITSNGGIRNVPVYFTFNLSDPLYNQLNYSGSYKYLDGFGVRGIIIANFGGVIYALERDCPYNPNDSCATVTVQSPNLTVACGKYDTKKNWVPCCNSQFLLNGTLQKGPSVYSLKTYYVSQDPSTGTVTISN